MSATTIGTLPDGRDVRRVRLARDGTRLDVLNLGAVVDAWWPAGADRSVIVGLGGDVAARWQHRGVYPGVMGGRYLSRIRDGRFELDGTVHQLATNDRRHTLHGGPDGWDRRTWDIGEAGAGHVTLSLHSPDGDQGFPGAVDVHVTYRLTADEVTIQISATTDAPTVMGPGAHPYFDVGAGATLTVPATHYLPVDDEQVAANGLEPVAGTSLDARDGLALRHGDGIDLSYRVDGQGLRTMATLAGDRGTVEVLSDLPTLQVFTDGALGGIALEAQRESNGPNRPGADWLLRPGEVFTSTTVWRTT